jgi:RHS repeat-associated protein
VAAYGYSPHGAVGSKYGEVDNPFTYVGECGVMDDGHGLFYMRNRTYDALTGRFIQKDLLGFFGETNPYTYGSNNPIRYIDPVGYFGIDLGDWKFWAGTTLTAGGAALIWVPGFGQLLGPAAVKVGIGMMVTGVSTDLYSVATAMPQAAIDKANDTVQAVENRGQFKDVKLDVGADGKLVIPKDVLDSLSPWPNKITALKKAVEEENKKRACSPQFRRIQGN